MSGISCVSFRGHGTESTGSIAHRNQPNQCPTCGGSVNFRGHYNYQEEKKGTSTLGVIGGLAALTATAIIALGYAHKTNVLGKMKEGRVKDVLKKIEPSAQKCHEWCSTAKTKGTELWGKVKNLFGSKKS